ncbi:2-nitropropane dioxygenase [Candidatus Scalindua japonica]|uniref:2-nitropropane dioxygenase n=1 Tax=Candidatus Scalindua japonica TaxID=1284222 RepID=A0A286TUL5_9BACT|nr:DUF1573 domain-containing protein [Candidatus Scalindua japonica]GAX59554.1 2-nitropropane dioxygenase [Candidatus Scalindua japonica]
MKKLLLFTFLLFLPFLSSLIFCTGFVKADPPPESTVTENKKIVVGKDVSAQSPKIFFETPNHNFGQVFKGQKVEHIFKFENRGIADLEIKKVKTSCGCTAAILSDKIIPPGETGEIKTTFNTGSYRGKVKKSITVKSNDPDNLSYMLTISGEITELITTDPKRINFGSVYIGVKTEKTITVTSDSDFKINKVAPSTPLLNASITEVNANKYTIKVTSKGSDKIGRFSGVINLETDNSLQPKVTIPVFGEITGDITTYPKRIYYGKVKKGEGRVQKVFVKLNKENIQISGVKINPDYLSAEIIENYKKNNLQFLIEVRLHENAAVGKLNGLLEINTSSKVQPVIKVPIVGEVT